MRLLAPGMGLISILLVLGGSAPSASAATVTVEAQDFQFAPPNITIDTGDQVQWNFTGVQPHNVTAVGGAFSSATMTGGTYSFTFNTAGTFDYYCTIHGLPDGTGMFGTVTVQQQQEPTATNTPQEGTATPPPDPTDTPAASATPTSASTATAVSTPTPPAPDEGGVVNPVTPTPPASGGAGAGVGLPSTGSRAPSERSALPAAALLTFGAALLSSSLVWRRRNHS